MGKPTKQTETEQTEQTDTVPELVSLSTPELSDADNIEWVELATGVRLEGVLQRAFFVTSPGEAPRVAYTLMDPDGALWNFGEKHGLKCLRELREGTYVEIDVREKADIGKKRSVWRFDIKARPATKGAVFLDTLNKAFKTLDNTPF